MTGDSMIDVVFSIFLGLSRVRNMHSVAYWQRFMFNIYRLFLY